MGNMLSGWNARVRTGMGLYPHGRVRRSPEGAQVASAILSPCKKAQSGEVASLHARELVTRLFRAHWAPSPLR